MSGITPAPITSIATVTGNVQGNVQGNVVGSVASVLGNLAGNVLGTIPSTIKSIQQGTISLTGTNSSNTATISSVDISKSVVFWVGEVVPSYSTGQFDGAMIRLELTNATTVTATRDATPPTGVTTVGYIVLEFN